jgi:hypothetical protein
LVFGYGGRSEGNLGLQLISGELGLSPVQELNLTGTEIELESGPGPA